MTASSLYISSTETATSSRPRWAWWAAGLAVVTAVVGAVSTVYGMHLWAETPIQPHSAVSAEANPAAAWIGFHSPVGIAVVRIVGGLLLALFFLRARRGSTRSGVVALLLTVLVANAVVIGYQGYAVLGMRSAEQSVAAHGYLSAIACEQRAGVALKTVRFRTNSATGCTDERHSPRPMRGLPTALENGRTITTWPVTTGFSAPAGAATDLSYLWADLGFGAEDARYASPHAPLVGATASVWRLWKTQPGLFDQIACGRAEVPVRDHRLFESDVAELGGVIVRYATAPEVTLDAKSHPSGTSAHQYASVVGYHEGGLDLVVHEHVRQVSWRWVDAHVTKAWAVLPAGMVDTGHGVSSSLRTVETTVFGMSVTAAP